MQLSPRPARTQLTCPCGARLSVIPRLQGTEIQCPKCRKSVLVPGSMEESSTVVPATAPEELSPEAAATLLERMTTTDRESAALSATEVRVPVNLVPVPVDTELVSGFASGDTSTNGIQSADAAPGNIAELPSDNSLSPPQPATVSRSDRDIFGRIPGHGAAHMNTYLSETIPRSIRTLMDLSGYQNAANHIQQLRREGKVKDVPLSGGQVGWIIDPEWLKAAKENRAPISTPPAALLHSEPLPTPDVFVASDSVRKECPAPGDEKPDVRQKFRPIGLTAPTRRPARAASGEFQFDKHLEPSPKPEPAAASVPAQLEQLNLTQSQRAVFQAIASWRAAEGVSPTLAELQKATSLNRFETLNEVDALVRKGLIEFDRSIARGIRIIPENERFPAPESLDVPAIAPSATSPLPTASPVMPDLGIASDNLAISKVTSPITSTTPPADVAQPNHPVPDWLESLLASELLNRQYAAAGRRVPPREQLRELLALIISQGSAVHRESVCHTLGLPPIRYAGFLSMVMRLINIDNVPILTRDDAGDMIRLNTDLMCRQFGIVR